MDMGNDSAFVQDNISELSAAYKINSSRPRVKSNRAFVGLYDIKIYRYQKGGIEKRYSEHMEIYARRDY